MKNKKILGFSLHDVLEGNGDDIKPLNVPYPFIVKNYDRSLNGNYLKMFARGLGDFHFGNLDFNSDKIYEFICNFSDDEIYCLLREFYVVFSDMLIYFVLKYNITSNEIEIRKNWIDHVYLEIVKRDYRLNGDVVRSKKFYDIKHDIGLFFKIKYFVGKNNMRSYAKRINSYIGYINSYLFMCLFYESLKFLNELQYYENYIETKNTMLIYEDLYSYFYREIYV